MSKPNYITWEQIIEKIATETTYNHEQSKEFVDMFVLNGAPATEYGERLYNEVSSTCFYLHARTKSLILLEAFLRKREKIGDIKRR